MITEENLFSHLTNYTSNIKFSIKSGVSIMLKEGMKIVEEDLYTIYTHSFYRYKVNKYLPILKDLGFDLTIDNFVAIDKAATNHKAKYLFSNYDEFRHDTVQDFLTYLINVNE